MKIITKKEAHAKINLFLDIESKRDDGYHNVISVMQSVSLCDVITVEYDDEKPKKIEIYCNNPKVPLGDKNIVYTVANKMIDKGYLKICIEKNIPMAAGLAGGSTDAASVIVMLNEITGKGMSDEELTAFGAKIGADVPFCIFGGTKLTKGIGEQISDFAPIPNDIYLVIACMGYGVSTPLAYSILDDKYDNFKKYVPKIENLEVLNSCRGNLYDGMFNIFESVIIVQRPYVKLLKDTMTRCGSEFAMMSGSGPSVFGIFKTEDLAKKAMEELRQIGADAYICRPC